MVFIFWAFRRWRQTMHKPEMKQNTFGMCQGVHAFLFALAAAIILLGMFYLTAHTPLQMDDYDYMFSWSTGAPLAGFQDILRSQMEHYRLWGGRSVTHTLVQSCLYLGKRVFNVLNPLVYLCLLLEIAVLAGKRLRTCPWESLLAAHLVLFLSVSFFGVTFLWLDGACNYLWGTAIALLPILIIRSRASGGCFARGGAMLPAMFLVFIGGWTNENTACGILAAHGLYLLERYIRRKHVHVSDLVLLLCQAAGVCVMLLAPGNRARASIYTDGNLLVEYGMRSARVLYYALRYAFVPWICLAVITIRNKSARKLWIGSHFCFVAAVFSILALICSPEVSDRTYLGPIILLIIECLTYVDFRRGEGMHSRAAICLAAAAVICTGIGFFIAGQAVSLHEARWDRQLARIEQAAESGESSVVIDDVLSESPYTMSIQMGQSADDWQNKSLGKWFGIPILGSGQVAE